MRGASDHGRSAREQDGVVGGEGDFARRIRRDDGGGDGEPYRRRRSGQREQDAHDHRDDDAHDLGSCGSRERDALADEATLVLPSTCLPISTARTETTYAPMGLPGAAGAMPESTSPTDSVTNPPKNPSVTDPAKAPTRTRRGNHP